MPDFKCMPDAIDCVHITLLVIVLFLLYTGGYLRMKSEGMLGSLDDPYRTIKGGKLAASGVRTLDKADIVDPTWFKTGVSVGAEAESRGIAANTTFGVHDATLLGGTPYLPMYAP